MISSFISTVFNEEDNITLFLDSLLSQSVQPNEIIIVDAGSKDKTYQILKEYQKKNSKIKVFQAKGANRSRGRNIAIKKAKGDIILTSDAGCVIDKHWVREMLKYFPKEDFVAGSSKAIVKNDFEFFQARSTVKKVKNIARMSARNTAFKKKCWKEVGGYPEQSNTGEDHRFHINIIEKGYIIAIHKKPLISWQMSPTLRTFAKQFYGYGKGDREQRNFVKKSLWKNVAMIMLFWAYLVIFIASLFIQPTLAGVLLAVVAVPLVLLGVLATMQTKKISGLFWAPIIAATKRISYIFGGTFG